MAINLAGNNAGWDYTVACSLLGPQSLDILLEDDF